MGDPEGAEQVEGSCWTTRVRRLGISPTAAFGVLDGSRMAWMAPDGRWLIAADPAVTVTPTAADRFATAATELQSVLSSIDHDGPDIARPRTIGGFAFENEPMTERWRPFDSALWSVPRVQLAGRGSDAWLTTLTTREGPNDPIDGLLDRLDRTRARGDRTTTIRETTHRPDREAWGEMVRAAIDRIESGPLKKVVLAGALDVELGGSPGIAALLERLGRSYPDCHRFAIDPGEGPTFLGATPELLVRRQGDRVDSVALAGTVGRGDDDLTDAARARSLDADAKGRREHDLVRSAILEGLRPYVSEATVGDRLIRTLENVHHLESDIECRLTGSTHVLDLAGALHPTPAVGGVPTDAARAFIREVEAVDRGWYAGPIGWVDAEGDGTIAVGIRSALVDGDRARLFAGNGIVADSDPAAEWAELQLKYRPILDSFE